MKRFKIKSLESGLILGEVLEKILINGRIEYVVQNRSSRMFIKMNEKLILIQS
jgi:hypothetical protein